MFDSHPWIAIPLETYFPIDPSPNWFRDSGVIDTATVLDWFAPQKWFRNLRLDPDRLRVAVGDPSIVTYADMLRVLYRLYAEDRGKKACGNKTPRHVLFLPELHPLFPTAKFIHIIRDGRDVALSLLDVDDNVKDVADAARLWRRCVDRGREAGQLLGADRYREVRYEDLLEDPASELRRLCTFLGIPYDAAMLRYYDRGPEAVWGNKAHPKLSKPPTAGLRDWRTQMSTERVAVFESIAGATLARGGYELSGPPPGLGQQFRLRVRRGTSIARQKARNLPRRVTTGRRPDA